MAYCVYTLYLSVNVHILFSIFHYFCVLFVSLALYKPNLLLILLLVDYFSCYVEINLCLLYFFVLLYTGLSCKAVF